MSKKLKLPRKRVDEILKRVDDDPRSLPSSRCSSGRSSRTRIRSRPGEDQEMSDRVPLSAEIVESMCARIDASNLPEHDRVLIKAALRDYVRLGQTSSRRAIPSHRLLRMIFGSTRRHRRSSPSSRRWPFPGVISERATERNGASSYTGRQEGTVSHASLKKGDVCPGCRRARSIRRSRASP